MVTPEGWLRHKDSIYTKLLLPLFFWPCSSILVVSILGYAGLSAAHWTGKSSTIPPHGMLLGSRHPSLLLMMPRLAFLISSGLSCSFQVSACWLRLPAHLPYIAQKDLTHLQQVHWIVFILNPLPRVHRDSASARQILE